MKSLIILILCLNLAGIASSTEKNAAAKKEQSKPVLLGKPMQDANALKLNLNAISDSLQETNSKIKYLNDSIKASNARIKTTEEKLNQNEENSNSLAISFFIVNLILFLLIVTVSYFFYSKLKNRINTNELRITQNSLNGKENKEINKLLNEIGAIKQEFRQMQYKIDMMQREMKNINQKEKSFTEINPTIFNSEPKEVKHEEFFMSTPNADGSFNQSNSSQIFKATASFYRFIINKTYNSKAEFFFVDDERAVTTASDFPQTYIDPVCEAVNAVNNHSKRIVTLQPGIVEKNGDKWVLINKATIRYE